MTEKLSMTTERVDDIPVLLAHSDRMGIAELLDAYFQPHGNWEGTSLGWTTSIWLTHRAHILEFLGESFRFRQRLQQSEQRGKTERQGAEGQSEAP